MKIIIIGNSCSGKSTLAKKISTQHQVPHHDLDQFFWKDKKYKKANREKYILQKISNLTSEPSWVLEGVYTHLLQSAVNHADQLIWLDTPKEHCIDALYKREGTPSEFQLLRMEEYYSRKSGSSRASHMVMFEKFSKKKQKQTDYHLDFTVI